MFAYYWYFDTLCWSIMFPFSVLLTWYPTLTALMWSLLCFKMVFDLYAVVYSVKKQDISFLILRNLSKFLLPGDNEVERQQKSFLCQKFEQFPYVMTSSRLAMFPALVCLACILSVIICWQNIAQIIRKIAQKSRKLLETQRSDQSNTKDILVNFTSWFRYYSKSRMMHF